MPRSYNPRPWVDKTGVSFVNNGARGSGEELRLRHSISHAPSEPLVEQLQEDWKARRPYYIIAFVVSFVLVLAIVLFYFATQP